MKFNRLQIYSRYILYMSSEIAQSKRTQAEITEILGDEGNEDCRNAISKH